MLFKTLPTSSCSRETVGFRVFAARHAASAGAASARHAGESAAHASGAAASSASVAANTAERPSGET